jgi:hypothetical protein
MFQAVLHQLSSVLHVILLCCKLLLVPLYQNSAVWGFVNSKSGILCLISKKELYAYDEFSLDTCMTQSAGLFVAIKPST